MLLQGFERCNTARGILLAIAAAQADAADHLAVDNDRKAAHEDRKTALKTPLDPERLVAGQSRTVRSLVKQMGRTLVAGSGERFVPGNLRTGNARTIHALDQ